MYVYCDDYSSSGSASPGDDGSGSSNSGASSVSGGSTNPDDDDTGIGGGSAEPEGAGDDGGGRAFHGSTGKGVLRQMGQIMLSCTSHLSMLYLYLSLSRQRNTWL
jgi:hypothetical protein